MTNIITPIDSHDYLLLETFDSASSDLDGDTPYYAASGNLWVAYQATAGVGYDYVATAPTGGARGYVSSGASSGTLDNCLVDVASTCTHIRAIMKLTNAEIIDLYLNCNTSGIPRNDDAFYGVRVRIKNNSGTLQTQVSLSQGTGGGSLIAEDGLDALTDHSSVDPTVAFPITLTLADGQIHTDVGGVRRSYLASDQTSVYFDYTNFGTFTGFTISPTADDNTAIHEIRVW